MSRALQDSHCQDVRQLLCCMRAGTHCAGVAANSDSQSRRAMALLQVLWWACKPGSLGVFVARCEAVQLVTVQVVSGVLV